MSVTQATAEFIEQDNSNVALISLMSEPTTGRVKTITPPPDFDLLQGSSGVTKKGEMDRINEIAGRIMV